eukprot:Rmarinus@m.16666
MADYTCLHGSEDEDDDTPLRLSETYSPYKRIRYSSTRSIQYMVMDAGFVVLPDHPYVRVHNMVQAFCVAYIALVVPVQIGFEVEAGPKSPLFWLEALMDLFFLIDIYLNFHLAYMSFRESREGDLIVEPQKIRQHYLRTWFVPDLLSCLPIRYIMFAITGSIEDDAKILKLFRALRIVKYTQRGPEDSVKKESRSPWLFHASHLLKLLACIVYTAHIFACAWFYVGSHDENSEYRGWVIEHGLHDENLFRQYLTSFYWAFTTITTVGYGDIVGRTNHERVFCVITFIAGGVTFAFMVGSLTDVIRRSSAARSRFVEMMSEKYEYLRYMEAPPQLVQKVSEYYGHLYRGGILFNEKEILEDLPRSLRTELVRYLYRDSVKKVPLFLSCTESEITAICLQLTTIHAAEGDIVMNEGDDMSDLCIVRRGTLGAHSTERPYQQLKSGSYFGEEAFMEAGTCVSEQTIIAESHAEICVLNKSAINMISAALPEKLAARARVLRKKKLKRESSRQNQLSPPSNSKAVPSLPSPSLVATHSGSLKIPRLRTTDSSDSIDLPKSHESTASLGDDWVLPSPVGFETGGVAQPALLSTSHGSRVDLPPIPPSPSLPPIAPSSTTTAATATTLHAVLEAVLSVSKEVSSLRDEMKSLRDEMNSVKTEVTGTKASFAALKDDFQTVRVDSETTNECLGDLHSRMGEKAKQEEVLAATVAEVVKEVASLRKAFDISQAVDET